MDVNQFLKSTSAGGEALARQAWAKVEELVKGALPEHAAAIDAALAPDVVEINAADSGHAAEGRG